jgi:hypothetical protein
MRRKRKGREKVCSRERERKEESVRSQVGQWRVRKRKARINAKFPLKFNSITTL